MRLIFFGGHEKLIFREVETIKPALERRRLASDDRTPVIDLENDELERLWPHDLDETELLFDRAPPAFYQRPNGKGPVPPNPSL